MDGQREAGDFKMAVKGIAAGTVQDSTELYWTPLLYTLINRLVHILGT